MSDYTVKAYAAREQVSERTVRRWIQKAAVDSRRTPGGRLRVVAPGDPHGHLRTFADNRGHSDR